MPTERDQDTDRFILGMLVAGCLMFVALDCHERSRPLVGPPPGPFSGPWGSPHEGDLFYNPKKREQLETFRSTLGGKRHTSPPAGQP